MRRGFLVIGAALLAGGAGIALAQAGQDVDDEAVDAQQQAPAEQPAGRPPAPPPITLSSRPGVAGGEALYIDKCIMCHGPNGMGTGLLGRTRPVALLEARDNLPAEFVVVAARQGIGNMPAIPRGEVSDEELQAIAEYLAAGPHVDAEGERQQ
jgi:mono/diheme cytochrome c family protein